MDNMRSHIEGTSYACCFCPDTFSSKSDNDDHHERKHSEEKSNCDITKDKVTQEQDWINSSKLHKKDQTFSGDIFSKNFSFRSLMDIHRRDTTGLKPFQCGICRKRSKTRQALERHIRTHTGEKPFACDICKKRFVQRPHLNQHIQTHTGEKPFECDICKKKYKRKEDRNEHILTHHKHYECTICKKRFTERSNLNEHIRTHDGEKTYECDICKKRFKCRSNLNEHIRTHNGEKPYECDICKNTFTQKANLKRHILTHTGEKPYECDICKKRFTRKRDLKMHLQTNKKKICFSLNVQQSFANDSTGTGNGFVASNSEDSLKSEYVKEIVSVIPVVGNIKKENEDIELKFKSEIDYFDVKQSFEHCNGEHFRDVKIEDIEFKEEFF